jgi:precorrin-8X/cobalt-precorrin-8 methylmutase
MKPADIEPRSFAIIDEEAGPHDFDHWTWQVVRRMIHTTADFEYMKTVRIHPEAIERGISALRAGKPVFTDTEMARAGIRKAEATQMGVSVSCRIGDATVRRLAESEGITRSQAAVDAVLPQLNGAIYAVGNAPTALLRLNELIRRGVTRPALVIGLPVGFVNAAESKAELLETDIPYITNVGRKGGSNVAASVVNALLILAQSTQPQREETVE